MQQEGAEKTVVIIGGGITGLSTAFYLQKGAREQGLSLRCELIEADDKLGGKVQTERVDGFVIEKGPDSFLARKVAAVNLCRELGIDGELVGTNKAARKTYILHQGKLHRIPQGLNLGVPTQFKPFATTGLLSLGGKLRAGMDLVMGRDKPQGDQSLGAFLERRLGKEVVDNMAEPLLAGIYAGDLRKLSMRATFPNMEELVQKHGSLVRGMMAQARALKARQAQAPAPQTNSTADSVPPLGKPKAQLPNSVFLTFRDGLSRLIESLADALTNTQIRTSTSVTSIEFAEKTEQGKQTYEVRLSTGETIKADAVVLTTPPHDTTGLLPRTFTPKSSLQSMHYASVATVVMAYAKGSFDYPLDASGFVVPRKEGRTITACTWTSSKWQHTAQDGNVLIRFYVGRSGDEAIVDESDEEIIRRVRKDMKEIMGITAEPLFYRVSRWRKAMPQYTVGHLDRVKAFVEQARTELPGLFFAGAGYTGLGIPDCIGQGITTSEQTLQFLK